MNPEQQRIAIAEACGYYNINLKRERARRKDESGVVYECGLPDYLNDLNAMHEAEKIIFERMKWEQYNHLLKESTGVAGRVVNYAAHATAAQRAEAFLKTIGKWEDGN